MAAPGTCTELCTALPSCCVTPRSCPTARDPRALPRPHGSLGLSGWLVMVSWPGAAPVPCRALGWDPEGPSAGLSLALSFSRRCAQPVTPAGSKSSLGPSWEENKTLGNGGKDFPAALQCLSWFLAGPGVYLSPGPQGTAAGPCVPGEGVCCSGGSVCPWNGRGGGCCTHGRAQTQQKLLLGCSCWPNSITSGSQLPAREMNIQGPSTARVPEKPRKMKSEGGGGPVVPQVPHAEQPHGPVCLGHCPWGGVGGTAPKAPRGKGLQTPRE